MHLRGLIPHSAGETGTKQTIEFRQHPPSKDKTAVTHWIRFCTAFVRNSARLRAPMALKSTTSLEEEFDLLFEYVVKDRPLRNYYRDRRDRLIEEEERARSLQAELAVADEKKPTPELKRQLDVSLDSLSFF